MRINRNLSAIALVCLTVSHLFTEISGPAQAQVGADEIPEHAGAKHYGGGWPCNPRYRQSNGACAAIEVPENGYATNSAFGAGWECRRGYREMNGGCTSLNIPLHGYLTEFSYGPRWACERGYRSAGNSCVEVEVPESAHLTFSGNDLECDKPYKKRSNRYVQALAR